MTVVSKMTAIIILAVLTLPQANAHTNPTAYNGYVEPVPYFSKSEVESRLDNISSVFDIRYTTEVGKRIKEYTVSYRIAGERLLGKVDLFFPLFEQKIAEKNLPQELKYIAVVESNLDPTARSSSGAAGLWQFMKSTGRMQGLEINDKIDERKDPIKSTEAALDYLEYLHGKFGDWTLAMAAYNCGPGGVRKAIRKSGGKKTYWEIRKYLPSETRKYIPRVIAAMYLMQYYHEHNLVPVNIEDDIKYVYEIKDKKHHSFNQLAAQLDLPVETLRTLNPQFKKSSFPKHDGDLILIIPNSKYERYVELFHPHLYKDILADKKALEYEKLKMEIAARVEIYRINITEIEKIKHNSVHSIRMRNQPIILNFEFA